MSIRAFFLLVLGVIAVALPFAGCGSSGDSASASEEIDVPTGSLSKGQFVRDVDGICAKAKSEFQRAFAANLKGSKKADTPSPAVLGEALTDSLGPPYERLINEIKSTGAPAGDEDQVSAFVNALQQDLDQASENPGEAFQTGRPFSGAAKKAKAYGLTGCVQTLD